MGTMNLLIVDENEDFRLALEKMLQDSYHVYYSCDGRQALETAYSVHPDVIILDLMLTKLDGITLLHAIRDEGMRPTVLVVTRMFTNYIFEAAEELGIAYVIRKPCIPSAVAQRVLDLSQRIKNDVPSPIDTVSFVGALLKALSFSPKHLGHDYLREAILLKRQHPEYSITKDLYPQVAAICGTTAALVERSIRSAINSAWNSSGKDWSERMPSVFDKISTRPSNGLLITLLAEYTQSVRNGKPYQSSDASKRNIALMQSSSFPVPNADAKPQNSEMDL